MVHAVPVRLEDAEAAAAHVELVAHAARAGRPFVISPDGAPVEREARVAALEERACERRRPALDLGREDRVVPDVVLVLVRREHRARRPLAQHPREDGAAAAAARINERLSDAVDGGPLEGAARDGARHVDALHVPVLLAALGPAHAARNVTSPLVAFPSAAFMPFRPGSTRTRGPEASLRDPPWGPRDLVSSG